MTQALIMRNRSIALSDAEKHSAWKVMTESLHGVDEPNQKRWVRFLRAVFKMEDGEIAQIGTKIPRSGPFHRFHMAVEQAVFDAQERFNNFEQFRNWIKIASGLVVWVPGPKGGIVPLPKSISYAEMEEGEMREFHAAMLTFLHGEHAAPFLWKHLDADEASTMMTAVLSQFERDQ